MIELARRARRLPAPPPAVFDDLIDPHRQPARPWLRLLDDETEPRVLRSENPHTVVWSSLCPRHPHDEIHLRLTPAGQGPSSIETLLEFTLLTPDEAPDASHLGHVRHRLNHLFFADLRFSYGQ